MTPHQWLDLDDRLAKGAGAQIQSPAGVIALNVATKRTDRGW